MNRMQCKIIHTAQSVLTHPSSFPNNLTKNQIIYSYSMGYARKSTKFRPRESPALTARNRSSGAGGALRAIAADQFGEECPAPAVIYARANTHSSGADCHHLVARDRPVQTNEQSEKRPLVGGHGGRRGLLSHAQST
jgi:hypothetical protein